MKQLERCPVCDASAIRASYSHVDDRAARWHMWECSECTHGFLNPQPHWAELSPYYADPYPPYAPSHASDRQEEAVISDAVRTGMLRHASVRKGIRLLDVGCGGGYFLRLAAQLGAIVEGVEPSEYGVKKARAQGLQVFHGTVDEFLKQRGAACFDTITANHVLEHVPDPHQTLGAMRLCLAPGGRICIAVPNAIHWACRSLRGRWHSTDIPRHLMQFSSMSVARCAQGSGLRVERLWTVSLPSGVAGSLRQWLRLWLLIPIRVTMHLRVIDSVIAPWLAKKSDAANNGEAILAWLVTR